MILVIWHIFEKSGNSNGSLLQFIWPVKVNIHALSLSLSQVEATLTLIYKGSEWQRMLTRGLTEQGFPARHVWLKENPHFKEQRKDIAEQDGGVLKCCGCTVKIVQRRQRSFLGAGRLVSGECGGVEAEGLALIGGERGPVALEVSGNAATGGARTIAERLDASLPLELCCIQNTHTHTHREKDEANNNIKQVSHC